MSVHITGRTAKEIAGSVRALVDRGSLPEGAMLPPVRALADQLGVNRNTVVAAYRQLVQARVAVTRGRAGTSITRSNAVAEEGFASDTVLRDLGSGNPDPALLPDPLSTWVGPAAPRVLYGEPTTDADLARWATEWMVGDQPRELRITVTAGAVDAVERLLAAALTPGDGVALEDPCFLASINTVRLANYRPVPVLVDDEGMTSDGLRKALDAGVRAVVCTPRAHNPTGVSLTERRAAQLRDVLADHPHVLLIEDDHFSLLARSPYHSIIRGDQARWALVRSVSKFLGPDLRVALVASDTRTAERLQERIRPGVSWVSHLLQRVTHGLLSDPAVRRDIDAAGHHYGSRNAAFIELLTERGLDACGADGLNVWVDVHDGRAVAERLMRRGWLVRTGEEFALDPTTTSRHLRLTVHDLQQREADRLADDLATCVREVTRRQAAP